MIKEYMKKSELPTGLKNAFKELSKMNEDSSVLSQNALSVVDDYIDSGSLALNAIVSGSLYKGIPKGRITGLVGPTGSGKTLILNKIIGNAQKEDPDVWGVIWDTENAYDPQMTINLGANPDQIRVNPVATVEDCRNEIVAFLDKIIEDPSLHGKIIIGIDSLGNLASAKEISDAEKGKDAVDMGTRAKALKSMMRILPHKCAKANATLIYTNHIYSDPSTMFPSLIKNQAGGKGPLYLASVIVQLAVTQEKNEANSTDEFIPIANRVNGVNLRALTVKNRFAPPFLETSMYLNFKTGLYKYSGLLEMAEAYNVIHKDGRSYIATKCGTKLGYKKTFKDDIEIWEKYILPELEIALQKDLQFSNDTLLMDNDDELEDTETTEK
jgi:RecA/RadA recombinase